MYVESAWEDSTLFKCLLVIESSKPLYHTALTQKVLVDALFSG
jgi:hypothetical protein